MTSRRFFLLLAAMLLLALGARIGYVAVQPATDPTFDSPMLDGAYYLDWARSLATGEDGPSGAYYLAPLYPFLLAAFLAIAGEKFALLYLLQHLAIVASSGLLALAARRLVGSGGAGLAAGALLLLYQPSIFFASRPLGEPVALLSLSLALFLTSTRGTRTALGAGALGGVSTLARPNLLLVPLIWICAAIGQRSWKRAAAVIVGVGLVILPVMLRNGLVSGHLVPVSSNAGLTLYHGNAPRALGLYTPLEWGSGHVVNQRSEATDLARRRSGEDLDPVTADRWWARQACRARAAAPWGTVKLLARKTMLLFANAELGQDYAPGIDRNPWRWSAPLPFAVLVGLAAAGAFGLGLGRSGGMPTWGAILGCALTPLIFYFSSRYRLPLATLMCIPGAAGLTLLAAPGTGAGRRRWLGLAAGAAFTVVSFMMPIGNLAEQVEAGALANRAAAWTDAGDDVSAERDLRDGLARYPDSAPVLLNLGVLLHSDGRTDEAKAVYRRAFDVDPEFGEAAANLAAILLQEGRTEEAVPILRRSLVFRDDCGPCWTNLVVALAALGDLEAARAVAADAAGHGFSLRPDLLETIGVTTNQRGQADGARAPGVPRQE